MKKLSLLILFLIKIMPSIAAYEKIVSDLDFHLPSGWRKADEILGVTHMLLSQKRLKKRATISIVLAEQYRVDLKETLSIDAIKTYQAKRHNWITKEIKGKVLKFYPHVVKNINSINNVHEFVVEYRFADDDYIEQSLYFSCKGHLINIKSLALLDDKEGKKEIETIFRSLRCKK